jgi:hypothetical protein
MRAILLHIVLPALVVAFLTATDAVAQVDTPARRTDTSGVVSAPRGTSGAPDSLSRSPRVPAPGTYVMTKDPLTATLLSIIPGGGQLYTEQYLKAPIFFGVATFFVVQALYYHNGFVEWADKYDALPVTSILRSGYKANREFNRDNRDRSIAYFVGVQILSMIDAYVGAHLFDFDVDEEPGRDAGTSKIYIDPLEQRVGLWLRF